MTISAVVFDAYGTLFDVSSIEQAVERITPRAADFAALWRAKQLEYAFLRTLMLRYADFEQITAEALQYALARFGLAIDAPQREALLGAWLHVAAYPDAAATLQQLAQYRRALLSNGTPRMLESALVAADLAKHVETVLSVDQVRLFKPHGAVYALVEQQLGVRPVETAFVSANGWDIAGATAFGFHTFWVNRAGLPAEQLVCCLRALLRRWWSCPLPSSP